MKKTLFSGLVIATTIFLLSCADSESVSAIGNRQILDTNYTFDKAIIDLHNEVITVEVETWKDYDGEQLQIKAKDGTVYLTSSYNCTLIKTK